MGEVKTCSSYNQLHDLLIQSSCHARPSMPLHLNRKPRCPEILPRCMSSAAQSQSPSIPPKSILCKPGRKFLSPLPRTQPPFPSAEPEPHQDKNQESPYLWQRVSRAAGRAIGGQDGDGRTGSHLEGFNGVSGLSSSRSLSKVGR